MESEILDGNFSTEGAGLSEAAKGFLGETAKWAKFIAIVNFVFIGFMVIGAFSAGAIMGTMAATMGEGNPALGLLGSGLITFFYLLFAAVWFIPNLFLYQFATKTQVALKRNDEPALTDALGKLKSHYKYWGIIWAIIIGFYALLFVFGMLGAMM